MLYSHKLINGEGVGGIRTGRGNFQRFISGGGGASRIF